MESLGCCKDLKKEVWTLCLKFLEPSELNNIKVLIYSNYQSHLINTFKAEEFTNLLSYYFKNCELFIKAIMEHSKNTLLNLSLESILNITI